MPPPSHRLKPPCDLLRLFEPTASATLDISFAQAGLDAFFIVVVSAHFALLAYLLFKFVAAALHVPGNFARSVEEENEIFRARDHADDYVEVDVLGRSPVSVCCLKTLGNACAESI